LRLQRLSEDWSVFFCCKTSVDDFAAQPVNSGSLPKPSGGAPCDGTGQETVLAQEVEGPQIEPE
jgi:hypothetical protein